MTIDLFFLRASLINKYNEILFAFKFNGKGKLNCSVLPLVIGYALTFSGAGRNTGFPDREALIFGGCETLRQINNYFILYRPK